MMSEPDRVSPEGVRQKLESGTAILVCAYEDEARFGMMHLEGAISFNAFKSKLPSLGRNQEIIFY